MSFLMLHEMFPQGEDCQARGTLIVLLSVRFPVPNKMKGPSESHVTFVTFEGLSTSGGFLTLNRLSTMTRWTAATLTLTRYFSSVNFLMLLEVNILTESFPTFLTYVASVGHRMHDQVRSQTEFSLVLFMC